jgi:hypothetical protein
MYDEDISSIYAAVPMGGARSDCRTNAGAAGGAAPFAKSVIFISLRRVRTG